MVCSTKAAPATAQANANIAQSQRGARSRTIVSSRSRFRNATTSAVPARARQASFARPEAPVARRHAAYAADHAPTPKAIARLARNARSTGSPARLGKPAATKPAPLRRMARRLIVAAPAPAPDPLPRPARGRAAETVPAAARGPPGSRSRAAPARRRTAGPEARARTAPASTCASPGSPGPPRGAQPREGRIRILPLRREPGCAAPGNADRSASGAARARVRRQSATRRSGPFRRRPARRSRPSPAGRSRLCGGAAPWGGAGRALGKLALARRNEPVPQDAVDSAERVPDPDLLALFHRARDVRDGQLDEPQRVAPVAVREQRGDLRLEPETLFLEGQ